MRYGFKNARVYEDGVFKDHPMFYVGGGDESVIVKKSGLFIFPGFLDVHVHLRQPGFCYKETILTGSLAAAHGGYTDICAMPNLNPVPDCAENLRMETDIIKKDAAIGVHPYAAITVGEKGERLVNFSELTDAVAFSDDGKGVRDADMMKQAMSEARHMGRIIAAHCEDGALLNGGYIHDGQYAKMHGHRGICSKSEWAMIERDLDLAAQTGCAYHVCHISAKESVELIRQAKKQRIDVTCETAPHYLTLTDMDMREDGRFKMNPPIRSKEDRDALLEGITDGTIDMIATDHAPHSAQEKSRGLKDSLMGVVGLETAFPVLYTKLVKQNIITLERLIALMSDAPRKRFKIPSCGYCAWDLQENYEIDPNEFLSKGKATPFMGEKVFGRCVMTIYGGKKVWEN